MGLFYHWLITKTLHLRGSIIKLQDGFITASIQREVDKTRNNILWFSLGKKPGTR
jgi:hypothetical protein